MNFGINNIFDKEYAVANSYEYDPTNPGGANVKIVNEPGAFYIWKSNVINFRFPIIAEEYFVQKLTGAKYD